MRRRLDIPEEDKAGLYLSVILHLAVVIVLLIAGLDFASSPENSFILDFSKAEEVERMQERIAALQREAELRQAVADKLLKEIGEAPAVRNIAVNRSELKDDRGTDAEQLYKDAERLRQELDNGYDIPEDDSAAPAPEKPDQKSKESRSASYSGPSVVSYTLEGRKASSLNIPAYRCIGAGRVTVIITVNPQGQVINAKIDDAVSSADGCLRQFAVRAARLSRFSASTDAPSRQAGEIVYEFIAQ